MPLCVSRVLVLQPHRTTLHRVHSRLPRKNPLDEVGLNHERASLLLDRDLLWPCS